MKVKDLIQALLQHDMYEEVRVEAETTGGAPTDVMSVERVNKDGKVYVAIKVCDEVQVQTCEALQDVFDALQRNGFTVGRQ